MIGVAALAMATAVFGQANLAGKWQTDDVAAVQAGTAQARAGQTIILDLKMDGGKPSGTLNELGNGDPLTIESGTVDMTAKTMSIVTQPRGVTWNIALTDDNTLTVTGRVFGGGGGRGGAGGGGRGGAGGGAPGAGGPGAGGGAPGAGGPGGGRGAGAGAGAGTGAPPAGGAPGAGGPGGGGGQGGGRGGRGGGGAAAPIVLHRVK